MKSKGIAMLWQILIGIAALVVLFVLIVATRPAAFRLERSTTVAAPAEKAFNLVNDFHAWSAWSPWEKLDPALKRTYEGSPSGQGAIYSWVGNKQVGEGRMTIERSDRPSRISIKLEFLKPFAATNQATFTFDGVPEGTRITWAMEGRRNFAAKAFALFVDFDKLVGADFERGLAALKGLAEDASRRNTETLAAAE